MIRNTILFLISCIIMTCGYSSAARPARPLKVMTYNVYNGFDHGKDRARQEAAASWIASERPDVVAFQELCGFTEAGLREFAAKWGHPYVAILKEEGFPVGLTSNRPIMVRKKMTEGLWHGMLHAVTRGTDFFVVHLCPSDYRTRMKEADQLLSYMKTVLDTENDRYAVLGDFNAHAPFDASLDRQYPALLEKYLQLDEEKKSVNRETLSYQTFDYSVLSRFMGFPLIDICHDRVPDGERFSFPSPIHFNPPHSRQEITPLRERLDFVLACPRLAALCVKAGIVNSGVTDRLSDHYPVVATFMIPD